MNYSNQRFRVILGFVCLLLCLISGGRASSGGNSAKLTPDEWVAERTRLFVEQRPADGDEPLKPEETREQLKRLLAAFPSEKVHDWRIARVQLENLVMFADVKEEHCRQREPANPTNLLILKMYEIFAPVDYFFKLALTRAALGGRFHLDPYMSHFERKQLDACAARLTNEVNDAVVRLSASEQDDANNLIVRVPDEFHQCDEKGNFVKYNEKALAKALHGFIEDKIGCPLAERMDQNKRDKNDDMVPDIVPLGDQTKPHRTKKPPHNSQPDLFNSNLAFCVHVMEYMADALTNFHAIRHYYVNALEARLSPDTVKWLRTTRVCRLVYNNEVQRGLVYREAAKKSKRPSKLSRWLKPLKH